TRPPFATAIAYVVAALVLLTVVLRFRHYRLWEIALLAGLALLANLAVRSLQDWLLLTLALGVPHLAALLCHLATTARRRGAVAALLRLDRACKRLFYSRMLRFQPRFVIIALLVLLLVSVTPSLSREMPLQDAPEWPAAATRFLEHSGLRGRVF